MRRAAWIAAVAGTPSVTAPNMFMAQGSLDKMGRPSAAVHGVFVALMTVADEVPWPVCGPRCGAGEARLPANGPGRERIDDLADRSLLP